MGSRSTTDMGLTPEARLYLGEFGVFEKQTFMDGYGKEMPIEVPVTEKTGERGMFQEIDLVKYKMKDGTWSEEFIQASPWSSGPVEFIGLKHDKKKFLWDEKEIDKI